MSEILNVTEDPEILRDLRAKLDGDLDSRTLAEYAHSIGLFPPGYEEGQFHTIVEYWPPGHEDAEGLLVWEVGLDSPAHDSDDGDSDERDYEDGWGALFDDPGSANG